ncbi:MAG: type II toxin-antitoxin system YoeB family toxin [Candidatus Methanoplasma sp.]|jgi:Txe/YoeB family toxin of toxin-antitoxin system|nr:type II toxin-antitoxin system YoeB family toxin [Candidatus Methanoplasma sp.]
MYRILLSKKAKKDLIELERAGSKERVEQMLLDLSEDPFSYPSKKLKGEATGLYSRRLNITDRVVFEIKESPDPKYEGEVRIIRMRTHYKGIVPIFLL